MNSQEIDCTPLDSLHLVNWLPMLLRTADKGGGHLSASTDTHRHFKNYTSVHPHSQHKLLEGFRNLT